MSSPREEAKQRVAKLVADYQALTPAQVKTYHEARTKQGFVLPLFQHLGWDVFNTDEVAPEEKASRGRVDYAFKLKGVSRFYLEAKPLNADLNDPEYVKQAVTYAYNKGVTWAGLTSFDRLRLFNSQTGQSFLNLTCQDYLDDFDRLWLLSRQSAESGALDNEAAKVGALRPPLAVESRLFAQLRLWRQELFSQLHLYNSQLSPAQIDEVIQRLFNRLIFIRTCEDRGIEERTLLAAVNQWESGGRKPELIVRLKEVFRQFDAYYDSDLFMLHLVDQGFIEGSTLAHIVRGLYEVAGGQASYDFSVMDADVLGAVYEQYLGHVASVVKQRAQESQAQISLGLPGEDISLDAKKQKRKEQGIFYTPRWVTDYIVRHTVRRFIEEHTHDEILNIKVLDPACGSGSFLIRAYDELLGYHARVKGKPILELDQWERLPALTGNIFGVDLDGQAVEIARLNLLLRSLARRETLPSLADNVRRGNSLISGGETELKPYFGESWPDRRPFHWEQEFCDIMGKGGFDIVIGNPPYVRIQSLPRDEAEYYRNHYDAAFGSFDIYVLFIEKAIKLLKSGGQLGFITSGKFLKSDYGKKIQQLIHEQCTVEDIIDLSAQQVFAEATTYPVIIVLRKGAEKKPLNYIFVPTASTTPDIDAMPAVTAGQDAVIKGVWPLSATDDKLLTKLAQKAKPLGEITERIFQGLVTSADKIYILEKRGEVENGKIRGYSRSLAKEVKLESALLKPLLMGNDIERYRYPAPVQLLLFPYKVTDDQAELITPQEFASSYPLCWQYLLDNRRALENREKDKMKHENWYAYVYPKSLTLHDKPKLLTGVLANKSRFTIDKQGIFYFMGGGNAGGYGITLKSATKESCLYVLGLLNSTLLDFNLKKISSPFRGGFFSYAQRYIERLPIRQIDFANPADSEMHDDLVLLVERMLHLHRELQEIPPEHAEDGQEVERKIRHTDEAIDNLVCDLYGLSESERRLVVG